MNPDEIDDYDFEEIKRELMSLPAEKQYDLVFEYLKKLKGNPKERADFFNDLLDIGFPPNLLKLMSQYIEEED